MSIDQSLRPGTISTTPANIRHVYDTDAQTKKEPDSAVVDDTDYGILATS